MTKNVNIEKYGYSGYGIAFDRRSIFSFPGGGFGQNLLIFGVDMSSSAHIDNKKKDILVYIKASKCSGSCNNINDPYAKICVPDAVKDLNVKVFNLISKTNETRHIKWLKTHKV